MSVITETMLDEDKEYEIVNGQAEEKEMGGAKHGGVGLRLSAELWMHVKAHKLGGVYGPDTTFRIGQNVRLPDVAFVSAARIPAEGEPDGIWEIAPDLAIEIVSPSDFYVKVNDKMRDYFSAGVREVWIISPQHRTVTAYHSPTRATILTEGDELTSDETVPGFRCKIAELFKSPGRA